jgi:hypothetical protein
MRQVSFGRTSQGGGERKGVTHLGDGAAVASVAEARVLGDGATVASVAEARVFGDGATVASVAEARVSSNHDEGWSCGGERVCGCRG